MNIYIYGSSKFKKQMNTLMKKSNLHEITQDIKNINILEETISNKPNDIYLIDSEKIISKNIITDKINFLKPKDSIYKETLMQYGIDDMCFNSNEALLNYIIDKIDKQDSSNVNNNISSKSEEVNMADITQIEHIDENDLLNALEAKINNISINDEVNDTSVSIDNANTENTSENKIELNSQNIDEVSELLKQLLNNKTLELSIKIKDS